MESQVVRRRVNLIAGHLAAAHDEISSTSTFLFPVSCSGSLSSVMQRRDNMLYFARQGVGSQSSFMQQNSSGEASFTLPTMPAKSTCANRSCDPFDAPTFSKPVSLGFGLADLGRIQSAGRDYENVKFLLEGPRFARAKINTEVCNYAEPITGNPTYARPNKTIGGYQYAEPASGAPEFARPKGIIVGYQYAEPASEGPEFARPNRRKDKDLEVYAWEHQHVKESSGHEWSPRMNIAETGMKYTISLELPGVSINEIKVEVSDQALCVTGSRPAANSSNDLLSVLHKREIVQGPYRAVWPLPANVNKDSVSADFVNGLLQITVPKLVGSSRLFKANI